MLNTQENTSLQLRTVVFKTDCYELHYQEKANRIIFTVLGFWKNEDVVSDLLHNLNETMALAQDGFTLIADLSAMVTHPQLLNALHIQLQKNLLNAGLAHGAYIEPNDKIATFQVEQTMQASQINLKRFTCLEEAEKWLNGVSHA